jgi:hypothetical protein
MSPHKEKRIRKKKSLQKREVRRKTQRPRERSKSKRDSLPDKPRQPQLRSL